MTQLRENIATFDKKNPLSKEDVALLYEVADAITKENNVPCTACRYCTEKCPMELDIPNLISLYNEYTYTGGGFLAPMRVSSLPEDKRPSACLGCRACEEVCPQCIKISEVLSDFNEKLGKKK
jgi:predicted aldo/keto reductase-like oxidoreductase